MRELKHGGIAVACGVIVVLSFLMLFLCSAWLLWSVPFAQMLRIDCLERVRIWGRRPDGTRRRLRRKFRICVDRSSPAFSPKVPRFLVAVEPVNHFDGSLRESTWTCPIQALFHQVLYPCCRQEDQ